jgi:hypothetical protein
LPPNILSGLAQQPNLNQFSHILPLSLFKVKEQLTKKNAPDIQRADNQFSDI